MLIFKATLKKSNLEDPVFSIYENDEKILSNERLAPIARYFNDNHFIDLGQLEEFIQPEPCCNVSKQWFPHFKETAIREKKNNSMDYIFEIS